LGTALVFGRDEVQDRLWRDDFDLVPVLGDLQQQTQALEAFLDRLSASSSAINSHLLDPSYAAVLDTDELEVAAALRSLVTRVRAGLRVPEMLETVLRDLGGSSNTNGAIPRSTVTEGRQEFTQVLSRWLRETGEPTIGDVGAYGGRPWLRVNARGHGFHLNADSTRTGVEAFLGRGDRTTWSVVANRRGRVNKVVIDGQPIPGFFLYLDGVAEEPFDV